MESSRTKVFNRGNAEGNVLNISVFNSKLNVTHLSIGKKKMPQSTEKETWHTLYIIKRLFFC